MSMTPLVRTLCKILFLFCIFLIGGTLFPLRSSGENEDQKEGAIQFETGLYYTVQEGDTLWNISQQFYDSPYVWPEVWRKNEYIRNPHWIEPGDRIKLYDKIDISVLPASVPPTHIPPPPLQEEIPKEQKPRKFITCNFIDRVGFIRGSVVRGAGKIFGSVRHKVLLSIGDTVYIHGYKGSEFNAGDKFTVFRAYEPLKHPLLGKLVGVQHLILGTVVITEVLPDMIIGNILESYRAMYAGDLVMPYEGRSPRIELVESVPGLEGMIISADEQDRESILAEGMVAFIDRGEDNGVKSGQVYDIYIQEEETFYGEGKKCRVFIPPVVIGNILILRAEQTTATVLITKAVKAIRIGEKIHTGFSPYASAVP